VFNEGYRPTRPPQSPAQASVPTPGDSGFIHPMYSTDRFSLDGCAIEIRIDASGKATVRIFPPGATRSTESRLVFIEDLPAAIEQLVKAHLDFHRYLSGKGTT
jgi:hypothetical protein